MFQVFVFYGILVILQFILSIIIACKLDIKVRVLDIIILFFFSLLCFPIVVVLIADLIWGQINGR